MHFVFALSVRNYLDGEVLGPQSNSHFDYGQRWTHLMGLYCSSHGVLPENTDYKTSEQTRVEKTSIGSVLWVCWLLYLEELKQHVVEMGGHIDNMEWLARVFGCGAFHIIYHRFNLLYT